VEKKKKKKKGLLRRRGELGPKVDYVLTNLVLEGKKSKAGKP